MFIFTQMLLSPSLPPLDARIAAAADARRRSFAGYSRAKRLGQMIRGRRRATIADCRHAALRRALPPPANEARRRVNKLSPIRAIDGYIEIKMGELISMARLSESATLPITSFYHAIAGCSFYTLICLMISP